MSSNDIVFFPCATPDHVYWDTYSTVNKRTYFCTELDCCNEAERYDRICDECYAKQRHVCSGDFDYDLGHVLCDFSDEHDCPQYKQHVQKCCADCGCARKELEPELLCDWYCKPCWQVRFGKKEATATKGALVVTRWQAHVAALTQCRHCHTRNTELRHDTVGDAYFLDCTACGGCHRVDKALLEAIPSPPPRCCADCGHVPKDGHFPFYRGDDPLCAACEENAYGPPEYEDWRERTGRCGMCDLFYDLRCSSDRRDLCFSCSPASLDGLASSTVKAGASSRTSVSYEDDDDGSECPGCGCNIRGGLAANGYCVVCWQEKFE